MSNVNGLRALAAESVALRKLLMNVLERRLEVSPGQLPKLIDEEHSRVVSMLSTGDLGRVGADYLEGEPDATAFCLEHVADALADLDRPQSKSLAIGLAGECVAIHKLLRQHMAGEVLTKPAAGSASRKLLQQEARNHAKALRRNWLGRETDLTELTTLVGERLGLYTEAIVMAGSRSVDETNVVASPQTGRAKRTARPAPEPQALSPLRTAPPLPYRALERPAAKRTTRPSSRTPVPPDLSKIMGLDAFADVPVIVGQGATQRPLSVAEALAALGNGTDGREQADLLQALVLSPARYVVPLLDRAVRRGDVAAAPQLSGRLRLAAVRAYSNYSANGLACTLAQELADSTLAEALSEPERLRLKLILARSKLRSGRSEEATRDYQQLMLTYPDRADVMIQYILSIFVDDPAEAAAYAGAVLDMDAKMSLGDRIFLGELCLGAGDRVRATRAFLPVAGSTEPIGSEAYLGLANAALKGGNRSRWAALVRRFGQGLGLEVTDCDLNRRPSHFAFTTTAYTRTAENPKIAVVMTAWNAEPTIEEAVRSVQHQTLTNLEIWLVDDCSEDGTATIMARLAEADSRVRCLANNRNVGTYASKNRALAATEADYVTFHDSDDWMHPRRLERQLAALNDANLAMSTSNWIRMGEDGQAFVRRGGPYVHLNPASTFLPRTLLERIGPFDNVRTGADGEFLARVRVSCGPTNVVNTGECLSLGLQREASLTTSGAAAFDEHRYSPVRLAYSESWLEWHLTCLEQGLTVRLDPAARPFRAPAEITVPG